MTPQPEPSDVLEAFLRPAGGAPAPLPDLSTLPLDTLRALTSAAGQELERLQPALVAVTKSRMWEMGVAPSLRPLLRPARYKGAYGGRGGMKSHFFAEALLQRFVDEPRTRFVCIREVQQSLDQSVKQLIEDKIEALGLQGLFRVLRTHIETAEGGIILFQGMQNRTAESMKSLEGYDVAWVEEAQSLSQASLDLLRPTIRKANSELWFSWNPVEPTDPVDAFFRAHESNPRLSPPPDSVCVRTSWADNPHLPEALRAEIEWDRRRDPEKFAHVWGGGYRIKSEATVFKNWTVEALDAPPGISRLFGGDWGFAQDPTVLLSGWLHPTLERTLVIDFEVWKIGCEIEDTPDLWDGLFCEGRCPRPASACERPLHGEARKWSVIGDSARPETISHMQRHGYPKLEPARKGPGSVEEGVKFLQGYDILVHPRCTHTVDELTYYAYKTDPKTGRVLPLLQDKKNHTIDSARYMVEPLRTAPAEPKVRARLLF